MSLVGGVLALGSGAFLPLVPLNPLAEAVYVAPLTLSGAGLLVLGGHARRGRARG